MGLPHQKTCLTPVSDLQFRDGEKVVLGEVGDWGGGRRGGGQGGRFEGVATPGKSSRDDPATLPAEYALQ